MEKEQFKLVTKTKKLSDEVKKHLSCNDIWLIENIGFPERMIGIPIIFAEPIVVKSNFIYVGYSMYNSVLQYGIDIKSKNIIIWNSENKTRFFINSTMNQFLFSSYSYETFIRRLIRKKSLGDYYPNYEIYAYLLRDLIFDIDNTAAEKGGWYDLITEMSMGAI